MDGEKAEFPESGASFPLRVFLHKDTVTVALDTTGESLHKRGYRMFVNEVFFVLLKTSVPTVSRLAQPLKILL